GAPPRAVAKWMVNELPRELKGRTVNDLPFTATQFAALIMLIEQGVISNTAGKEVLAEMAETGAPPAEIVETRGLRQISDANELRPIVDEIVSVNRDKAEAYRSGRTALRGFCVGQMRSRTGCCAIPE